MYGNVNTLLAPLPGPWKGPLQVRGPEASSLTSRKIRPWRGLQQCAVNNSKSVNVSAKQVPHAYFPWAIFNGYQSEPFEPDTHRYNAIVTISDQQGPSVINSDQKWQLVTISDHQWPSVIDSDQQWPSLTISDQQWPTATISNQQWPTVTISDHHWPTMTARYGRASGILLCLFQILFRLPWLGCFVVFSGSHCKYQRSTSD